MALLSCPPACLFLEKTRPAFPNNAGGVSLLAMWIVLDMEVHSLGVLISTCQHRFTEDGAKRTVLPTVST